MTPNPSDLAALVKRHHDRGVAGATPSRMIVDAIDADGLVLVRSVRSGAIPEGPYERLSSVGRLAPGDRVWVEPSIGTTGRPTYVVADKVGVDLAGPSCASGGKSQSEADGTGEWTDTTTWRTAMTLGPDDGAKALSLGPGLWTVRAVGGLAIRHSTGSPAWVVEIDGDTGTGRSLYVVTEMQMVDDAIATGVAGGRVVTVKVRYRPANPGTAYARNPWVMVTATRE